MQDVAAPNAPTAKFQLALPSLLAPISPHLAALHATRARLLHPSDADPSLAGTHCARCGIPLLLSGGRTRAVRVHKKSKTSSRPAPAPQSFARVLRRSCRACGLDEDVPLVGTASAPAFPPVRDRARRTPSAAPRVPRAAAPASESARVGVHAPPVSQPHPARSLHPSETPAASRSSSHAPIPPPAPGPLRAPAASTGPAPGRPQAEMGTAQNKARSKKKAGLQSLLARNREKQEQEKKRESQGLSAFLQGL
ncbi:hypothetical protein BD413DRAFT_604378 [Trametes elegans]|nr:hypothetical protein BD413DRAFT_604378 [Trametes elegans]